MHRTPQRALTLALTAVIAFAAGVPVDAAAQSKTSGGKATRESVAERGEASSGRTVLQDASMALMLTVQGDAREGCDVMDTVLEDPRLDALAKGQHAELLQLASYVFAQCDRMRDAMKQAQASAALDRTPNALMMTAMYAELSGERDVSTDALVALAREFPKDAGLQVVQIAWDNVRAMSNAPARQRTFLQGLFDARFDPKDADASELWFELARLHLDAGDVAAAKRVAAEVKGLTSAAKMRVDRRFDPVLADAPQLGDYKAQAARLLESLRAKQKAAPRAMALRTAIAEEMVLLGDYAGAVDFIDGTLADVRGASENEWEAPQYGAFLLRARASANLRQGKTQQAIEDFEMASMFVPRGAVDIPRLMLADQLCDLGRAKDAEDVADISVGGSRWLERVQTIIRVCTAVGTGDTARARTLTDTLRGAVEDNEHELLITALLRLGDVEAAAPLFIAQLDSPSNRSSMLLWAQNDRRLQPMPGLVDYRKAFDAMIARPDVQAALQKYGRVLDWDIYLGLE